MKAVLNGDPKAETDPIPSADIKVIVSLEDALKMATFGKFNYCLILVCGINLAAVLLETLGISFVTPIAQCDLNMSSYEKGILSTVSFIGNAITIVCMLVIFDLIRGIDHLQA